MTLTLTSFSQYEIIPVEKRQKVAGLLIEQSVSDKIVALSCAIVGTGIMLIPTENKFARDAKLLFGGTFQVAALINTVLSLDALKQAGRVMRLGKRRKQALL